MARKIQKEDHELLQWSADFSKKRIDMTVPRMRVRDHMLEDPDRWVINATLTRLKSQALQKYMKVEEETEETLSLDDFEDDYHERVKSEVDSSQYSFPTYGTISASTLQSRNTGKSNATGTTRSSQPTTRTREDDEVTAGTSREDSVVREKQLQDEIDQRVKAYLALDPPNQKYYSSTVKVFSDSSVADSVEEQTEPVELRKLEPVPVQTQAETLQKILLTPMPGPGFRMAQVAHPDDVFGPGRRLPAVYFLKPRVRIFSAFPHSQQFWCRQGNPIPVPTPSKRNTFLDSRHLSTNHPQAKLFPFRVRSYPADMSKFLADELIFIVEGRNIFVTGEKRKGTKVIRTVTEEICLPIDLDLNYIRVARTNKGEIIFEELWEYDGKTKG